MPTLEAIQDSLDLLEELVLKGQLPDREQEALRFSAALQIIAYASRRRDLDADDLKLLASLLSRWEYALIGRESVSIDALSDAFPTSTASLSRVLGETPIVTERRLQKLAAAGIVSLPQDAVSLEPILAEIAPTLIDLLYRELVDREGCELEDSATHHAEAIGGAIDELREFRPTCPNLENLRTSFRAFLGRGSVADVIALWATDPQAVYVWLRELAEFEDRLAVLSGNADMGLQSELVQRNAKRIMILGRLVQPSPANAA